MRISRTVRALVAWSSLLGLAGSLPGQNNPPLPCGPPQDSITHGNFEELPYHEENSPCSIGDTHVTLWNAPYTHPPGYVYLLIWDECSGVLYAQRFPINQQGFQDLGSFVDGLCNWVGTQVGPFSVPQPPLQNRASTLAPGPTVGFQGSQGFVFDDFNGDGMPDAAFPSAGGLTIRLFNPDLSVLKNLTVSLPFNARDSSNSSMIAADFNGDGKLDLAISNGGTFGGDPGGVAILLGNGDGTFQAPRIFPAVANPLGLAAGDLNHDGKIDLAAFSQYAPQFSILAGNGDGTLAAPTNYATGSQGYPTSILALDLNGDGRPDLAIANGAPNSITVLLNTGSGLGPPTTVPLAITPSYLAAMDLNGDGAPDLLVSSITANGFAVLMGQSNGSLQTPAYYVTGNGPGSMGLASFAGGSVLATADSNTGSLWLTAVSPAGVVGAPAMNFAVGGGQAIAAADLNGDGRPDAVIAGGSSDIVVSLANSSGGFSAPTGYPANGANQAVAIGDLNNDGKPDVVAAGRSTVSALLGKGDGTLQPAVGTTVTAVTQGPQTLALADFNRDGKLDAAVAETGSVAVLLGKGDGTFQPATPLAVGSLTALSVAGGDLNGDGIPDLAVLAGGPISSSGQYSTATLYLFWGKGDGTFQNGTPLPLQIFGGQQGGIVIGDWNLDGRPDLAAVSNGLGNTVQWQIDVLLGDGHGGFHETATLPKTREDLPVGITTADVNGDGVPDLVVTHCCGALDVTYLTGNGDGTFSGEEQLLSGSSPNATAVLGIASGIGFLFADGPSSGQGPGAMVALAVGPTPAPANSAPTIAAIGSAATPAITNLAPASIATLYGSNLASSVGDTGTSVTITDSTGAQRSAPLFYVSPGQINFYIPDATALGVAKIAVTNSARQQGSANATVTVLSPGVFELNASALAAAVVLTIHADNTVTYGNVYQLDTANNVISLPIDLSSGQVYLEIYGTGIRGAKSVTATVGAQSVPVFSSGAQGQYQGLDQVNVGPLPASLKGSGQVTLVLTADGQRANTVNVTLR